VSITSSVDNLSKAGWSWRCVSTVDSHGRTIWIAAAQTSTTSKSVFRCWNGVGAFVSNKTKCLAPNESVGKRQRNEEKHLSINVIAIGIG
jgi:hypothetical protein